MIHQNKMGIIKQILENLNRKDDKRYIKEYKKKDLFLNSIYPNDEGKKVAKDWKKYNLNLKHRICVPALLLLDKFYLKDFEIPDKICPQDM